MDQGTPFLLSMCHGPSSLVGINPLSQVESRTYASWKL